MRFHFDFMGRRRIFYVVSGALLVVAVAGFFIRGLNLGIDFTGGTQLTARFAKPVTLTRIDATLSGAGVTDFVAQFIGTGQKEVIISMPSMPESERTAVFGDLTKSVGTYTIVSFTKVTGSFSQQVVQGGIIAVILAALGIIIYMMFRFDLRFAVAGIFAVFWDAFVSLGVVALLHFTVNAPFVAGVLTIIGYSINDRIIIFDRVRENMKKRQRDEPLADIVNLSLNQTLGRSIATATVVILAMLAILILGGDTTRDLSATVVIGVVFGAYSSILLASPIWFDWVTRIEAAQAARRQTRGTARPRAGQKAAALAMTEKEEAALAEAEESVRQRRPLPRTRGRHKSRRRR